MTSSKPAVSIRIMSRSPRRPVVSLRSRVTPGWSSTMAIFRPASRLNSVDLPTFGRPTMATFSVMGLLQGQALACLLDRDQVGLVGQNENLASCGDRLDENALA